MIRLWARPSVGWLIVMLLSTACEGTPSSPRDIASRRSALTVSLGVLGDTYVTSGSPNRNHAGETFVRLQSSGRNRGLLFFDVAAIRQAVGAGTLISARLDLTIHSAGNNWGSNGRPIALHRLKQPSAEYSATWNCAIDAAVQNQSADCTGSTAWAMGSSDTAAQPWVTAATATATLTNNQVGIVAFDVTADVAAILGQAWQGEGWLLKKVDENQNGVVDFKAKEQNAGAQLVLDVQPPPDAGGPIDAGALSTLVPVSADTHVRQGQPNQNFGADPILRLQASGRNRALVDFSPSAIQGALQGHGLRAARVELTISSIASNWGTDRAIGAHTLRRGFTELGATWNCAIDANPSNQSPDCSGSSSWAMWAPDLPQEQAAWVDPPLGTALLGNDQTGVVTLDVTSGVACQLAGLQPFNGFLIKKAAEHQSGQVEFGSRESATPPGLRLEYGPGPGVQVTPELCSGVPADGGVGAAPQIVLESPAAGFLASGNVSVSGTVVGTPRPSVSVNGVSAVVDGDRWSVGLVLPDGAHTLVARAENGVGVAQAQVSITVDTAAPVVTIDTPADGTTTSAGSVAVGGTVADAGPIVALDVNGVAVPLVAGGFLAELPLPGLGAHTLVARAIDAAGNAGQAVVTVLRGEPPRIEITAPADGAVVGVSPLAVEGTASGATSVEVNGMAASVIDGRFGIALALAEGVNEIAAVAAANGFGPTATDALIVILDTTAPSIALEAPAHGAVTTDASVLVRGTISDATGVAAAALQGIPLALDAGTFFAQAPLQLGDNELVIAARDGLNNASELRVTVRREALGDVTRVIGSVVLPDGAPIERAEVSVASREAQTGPDGRFAIDAVPSDQGPLIAHARAILQQFPESALSVPTAPVTGGVTDVGEIVLAPRCIDFFAGASHGGRRVRDVVSADFDGDGRDDVAAVSEDRVVLVHLAYGPACLRQAVQLPIDVGGETIASADLNGDGHADLVTGNGFTRSLSVLLGNGDGSFQPEIRAETSLNAGRIALGDVGGDGLPDVVVSPQQGTQLAILSGNGDGTLAASAPFAMPGGGNAWGVTLRDLNGDQRNDLIVGHFLRSFVSVFFGAAGGGFGTERRVTTCDSPLNVEAAELSGDGISDLAAACQGSGQVAILRGNGTTFQEAARIAVGEFATDLRITDLDVDGVPDLVLLEDRLRGVGVLFGTGTANFTRQQHFRTETESKGLAVGDFDADGRPDLATSAAGAGIYVFPNDAPAGVQSRTFGQSVGGSFDFVVTSDVEIVDLDGDGALDAVAAAGDANSVVVFFGDGQGGFGPQLAFAAGTDVRAVAVGDVNGDGRLDIAAPGRLSSDVHVFIGGPARSFQLAAVLPGAIDARDIAIADLDGDGLTDIATANAGTATRSGALFVFSGSGGGGFRPALRVSAAEDPQAVAVVDIDRDGQLDVVTANHGFGQNRASVAGVWVLFGRPGGFESPLRIAPAQQQFNVAVSDLNGDGLFDVVAGGGGALMAILGRGGRLFAEARTVEAMLPAGARLLVGDVDADAAPDILRSFGGKSELLRGRGDGTFHVYGSYAGEQLRALADLDRDGGLDAVVDAVFGRGIGAVYNRFPDADGDHLIDQRETLTFGTDPHDPDSDADGLLDGFEARFGLDPAVPGDETADSDADGLTNLVEQAARTDPRVADSDGDGMTDGFEVGHGFHPRDPADAQSDPDGDGLDNLGEQSAGSHPLVADSDGDGLLDGFEVHNGGDPTRVDDATVDADGDGLDALAEQAAGTDPRSPDSDADGLHDGDELARLTGPLVPDSDGDLLPDGAEVVDYGTDPLLVDTDGGGRGDGIEVIAGTDPLDPADDQPLFSLPQRLHDGLGFAWDVFGSAVLGDLSDPESAQGHFDIGFGLSVNGEFFDLGGLPGQGEVVEVETRNDGRELVFGPAQLSELNVTRRVFVPDSAGFVRYVEVFENPTANEFTAQVEIVSLPSPAFSIARVGSSSGDEAVDAGDDYWVLDDVDGAELAALAHVYSGPGARVEPLFVSAGSLLQSTFELPVPAFGRAVLVHFTTQRTTFIESVASAAELRALEGDARHGIEPSELADVANFDARPDADGDGLRDPDELAAGTDPFDPDSDDDGLSDHDEVAVFGTDPLRAHGIDLEVATPQDGAVETTQPVTVAGQTSGATAVHVNGQAAPLAGGMFSVAVPLAPGDNELRIVASNDAGRVERVLHVTFTGCEPQPEICGDGIDQDCDGADCELSAVGILSPPAGVATDFAAVVVYGAAAEQPVSVVVNGVSAQLRGRFFEAREVPLVEGANTLTAIATFFDGSVAQASLAVTRSATPDLVVQLYSPAEGAVIPGAGLVVRGFISAADAVATVVGGQTGIRGESGAFELFDAALPVGTPTLGVTATLGAQNASDQVAVVVESSTRAVSLQATPATSEVPFETTLALIYTADAFAIDQVDFDVDGDTRPDVIASPSPSTVVSVTQPGLSLARAFVYTPDGVELTVLTALQGFLPQVELARFAVGQNPVDLAHDASGRLLVLDSAGRIHRYSAAGDQLGSFAAPGSGPGELLAPRALSVAADGRIFVADTGNDRVQVFGSDGSFEAVLGPGATLRQFSEPYDLEVAGDVLFVADTGNDRVQALSLVDAGASALPIAGVVAIGALGNDSLLLSTSDGRILQVEDFALRGGAADVDTPAGLQLLPPEAPLRGVTDLELGPSGLLAADGAAGQIAALSEDATFVRALEAPSAARLAVLEGKRRQTASVLVADGTAVTEIGLPVPSPVPALDALRDRLAAGDVEGALLQIHPDRRSLFREIYQTIAGELPAEAAAMASFTLDFARESRAIVYIERRQIVGGLEVVTDHAATLVRGEEGAWYVYDY
jgi:hypothetical protein